MRARDIKVGKEYIYKTRIVKVIKIIRGKELTKRNMHSGELFTGNKHAERKFKLNTGEEVFARELLNLY